MPRINQTEALALYERGFSDQAIAEAQGVTSGAVCYWRKREGLAPNFAAPERGKIDTAKALDLYRSGWSDTQIAKGLGCNQPSITRWRNKAGLPVNQPHNGAMTPEEARRARKLLREGQSKAQVAKALGRSKSTIQSVRRNMGQDDRLRTAGKATNRAHALIARSAAAIMAEIARACRHVTDGPTRDDAVQEIALALLEDRLQRRDIKTEARTYTSRAIGLWQSPYGPRSLDEVLGEDGFTLGSLIPCPHANAWLEHLGYR